MNRFGFDWQVYAESKLIEFAAQIGAPLLLVASLKYGLRAVYGLKVAIALTFAGHGFYALGFYPRPAGFTTMIMNILPLTEDQSHGMLLRVGFVDMLAALLIFIPGLSRLALMYCISWGFLTAFARTAAYFSFAAPLASLEQWLHETLFRLPHGALPLVR